MNKSIQYIADAALCTACGACCGVCPTHAVSMRWNTAGYLVAKVNRAKCVSCGLCVRICPSVASNEVVPCGCDPFHGVCLNAYIGYATDSEMRQESQSGGIVTALLCYLLEQGRIDGAIVNRFCAETNRPEVVCVSSRKEIRQAAGSYYCQSSVVKTILENRDKRLAAVVLGCQAESLALVGRALPKPYVPEYMLGLICAGQYSSHYIDDLVSLSKAFPSDVKRVRFKDKSAGGWPGDVKIYTAEGDHVLGREHRHRLKPVYEVYRCLLCFDQMNSHSDMVVGDPWGIRNAENSLGNSVIITRTQKGQQLVEDAVARGYIKVAGLPVDAVLKGQTVDSRLKPQFLTAAENCRETGSLLPVDECCFAGIPRMRSPEKQHVSAIRERLRYAREVYLECDLKQVAVLRLQMKRVLRRRHALRRIVRIAHFPLRLTRWVAKKCCECLQESKE